MKYLLGYLKKYKKESILAPVFKMLEACFDLIVPLIVADIINKGIKNSDTGYIITRFFILLAMAVLGLLSSFVAQYFAAKASIGTATKLRHDMLEKIQSLSLTELDTIGNSTLITRMTSDINQVQNGLNMFLRLFMRSPFIVFGSMILAFTINAELAFIFVFAIIILFIIVFGIMKITAPMYKNVQQNLDNVTEVTDEDLNGVRVIRAFSREKSQIQKFNFVNKNLLNSQLKVGRAAAFMNPLTYVVINTAVILILWMGSDKINFGVLMPGNIIALINYISQILVELVKLANLITQLGRSAAGMNRIGQIFDMQSSMEYKSVDEILNNNGNGNKSNDKKRYENNNGNVLNNLNTAVEFNDVSFKYKKSGANSLSNISFSALKGQTVGIIGGTGSGKTTLVNLILRLYDATDGNILINGIPIKEIPKKDLQKTVSVVPQKPQLFKGTVKSNLLIGNKNASEEQMWQALKAAEAEDFIIEKQMGLNLNIEQNGANLSGGQKQRLTIARALLADSEILILDDSLSALDFATDAAIRKNLANLQNKKTVFMISQRAGSIAYADLILVLDDGKIVGKGTHGELIKQCEIYREIYESQLKGGSINGK